GGGAPRSVSAVLQIALSTTRLKDYDRFCKNLFDNLCARRRSWVCYGCGPVLAASPCRGRTPGAPGRLCAAGPAAAPCRGGAQSARCQCQRAALPPDPGSGGDSLRPGTPAPGVQV